MQRAPRCAGSHYITQVKSSSTFLGGKKPGEAAEMDGFAERQGMKSAVTLESACTLGG